MAGHMEQPGNIVEVSLPLTQVWKANKVVVLKRSMGSTSYAGVDNPVFYNENTSKSSAELSWNYFTMSTLALKHFCCSACRLCWYLTAATPGLQISYLGTPRIHAMHFAMRSRHSSREGQNMAQSPLLHPSHHR